MKSPRVFFTSDLHLGHAKVASLRGFDSPLEHDIEVKNRWCDTVSAHDQVWVLGDLAASSPTHALRALAAFPGEKHLILGNHDKAHPMHRDAHRHLRTYLEVFASVAQSGRRRIAGTEVLLSHFPYVRDRGETRYTQWRLPNEAKWLLHGHTHGTERVTSYRHPWASSREIHVGVDAWDLTPVSIDTVAGLIAEHDAGLI